jgi:hypothetical protein
MSAAVSEEDHLQAQVIVLDRRATSGPKIVSPAAIGHSGSRRALGVGLGGHHHTLNYAER